MQSTLNIPNESGLLFRQDINTSLQSLATNSSGNSAPATTYAFQFWVDTSGAYPILKQRNAANSAWNTIGRLDMDSFGLAGISSGTAPATTLAFQFWVDTSGAYPVINIRDQANASWIVVGRCDVPNFGLLPLTGGSLSGPLTYSINTATSIPVGTTAQRPTGSTGMLRFNTSSSTFEGYNGTAWTPVGGGASTATATPTNGGTISLTAGSSFQNIIVTGSGGAVTLATAPFGASAPSQDGTEITLVGNSNTNTVSLAYSDTAKGYVGPNVTLGKYDSITVAYLSALDRYVLIGRSS